MEPLDAWERFTRWDHDSLEETYNAFLLIQRNMHAHGEWKQAYFARLMQTQTAIALNMIERREDRDSSSQLTLLD
jgi:hypothetical protein